MIEDDFYCTLKLKTGEEIFAKVAPSTEEDEIYLLVSNPIVVSGIKGRNGIMEYRIEPWLKTTTEDMFLLKMNDIVTMSESSDIEMIMLYQSYVRQNNKIKKNDLPLSRRMGYISNVNDAKEILEKIFKNS